MKMRWAWILPVLSVLALSGAQSAHAQGFGPGGMPPGYMPAGYAPAMPAGYMAGPGQPGLLPDVNGSYGAAPVAPPDAGGMGPQALMGGDPSMMGGPMMGGGMMGGGMHGGDPGLMGNCGYCGGMGCDACGRGSGGLGNGLLGDVFGLVAPYPDGGCAAVRWYDFSVDFMRLRRENAGRNAVFATDGVNGDPVLSLDDIDLSEESSFRFSAMFQFGPGSSVEFTYFGLFYWDSRATATSADNLFSVYSEFGLDPAGGYPETDESDLQYLDYESSFDSFEVNFRQRCMAPNCRYQGSWIAGVRYFKLDEDFNYFTQSPINTDPMAPPPGNSLPTSLTNINVHNNLIGAQVGGDLWVCVLPGLRVGGELKAGVYHNHIAQDTFISINTINNGTFLEELTANDVAFVGQADLMMTYRLNYQWTLRAGYQFLFVDGVALAGENFNPVLPTVFDPNKNRVANINDNGNVFYHGWNLGLEFMW
jgi:hypothetical protein